MNYLLYLKSHLTNCYMFKKNGILKYIIFNEGK